jgi:hypothetical protein
MTADPCRADRLVWYLKRGYDVETASRLTHMSFQTALEIAWIHCSVNNVVEEEEARTRHNVAWDKVLALRGEAMLTAWNALYDEGGYKH